MKTSLSIPDSLYRRVKQRAAEKKITVSELVVECLTMGLTGTPPPKDLPPIPVFDTGPPLVDIMDKDALYEAMDRGRDERLYGDGVRADKDLVPR